MREATPLQPKQKFGAGRFTLLRPLGCGGMGEVWLATDERLGEQVSLKFLPPEVRADPVALDDLRRETAKSHKLAHPNIVRIHDLHEERGGIAFIAMEFVNGVTLAEALRQRPDHRMSWSEAQPLIKQLCAVLDYAHREGFVHRALQPGNLLVDDQGRLKLADFGIAGTAGDSVSRMSSHQPTGGGLLYLSPQQLAGKRPQFADDVYGFGATLYELLSGAPPYSGGDATQRILHEPPQSLTERRASLGANDPIPVEVSAVVMASLAKDPAARPQSFRVISEWLALGPAGDSGWAAQSRSGSQAGSFITAGRSARARVRSGSLMIAGAAILVMLAGIAGYYAIRRPAGAAAANASSQNASSPEQRIPAGNKPSLPAVELRTKPASALPTKLENTNELLRIGFEESEGYVVAQSLIGVRGWRRGGWSEQFTEFGQGIGSNLISGSPQQAFVGGHPGATKSGTYIGVDRSLHFSPSEERGQLNFSWRQMITDSRGSPRNRFEWLFYNRQGRLLLGLLFDNDDLTICRRQADNSVHKSPLTFKRGQTYDVVLKINFYLDWWSATVGGKSMRPERMVTGDRSANLGAFSVTWWGGNALAGSPQGPFAGNNLMAFDDLTVTVRPAREKPVELRAEGTDREDKPDSTVGEPK